MKIRRTETDGVLTLSLEGWLDAKSAPELEMELEGVSPEKYKSLVFECGDLEFISSAGIRMIFLSHKQMDGNFKLRNVSDEIIDILNFTGMLQRIQVE